MFLSDAFPPPERLLDIPLRFTVSEVLGGGGSCMVVGKVESGSVGTGDKLVIQPGHVTTAVKKVQRDDVTQSAVFAGDYAVLTLGGVTVDRLRCDRLALL